jgi:hypothetical protein
MTNPTPDTNGWPQYKMSVVQQLEYLTEEMRAIREIVNRIDKELATFVTRDKAEADKMAFLLKMEDTRISLRDRVEEDRMSLQLKTAKATQEYNDWKLEIAKTFAERRGEDERSKKTWAVVITAITITINIAALITALVLIK